MKHLFHKRQNLYDYRQVFLDFHLSLQNIKDKNLLISSIVPRIYELVSAKAIYVFLENGDASGYQLMNTGENQQHDLHLSSEDGLIRWLKVNEKPLIVSFIPEYANIYSDNDRHIVNFLEAVLIYPLKTNDHLKGAIMLAEKQDNHPYHSWEMEMLSIILDNAALAIENIAYHEERETHLRHIYRADRLAVIGQLAAGAAHEIRNPLTSIKSMIQYVKGDIQEPKKQDMMKTVLQEVDRINEILTGLLSFSRQNNPVKSEFDLVVLIDQTIEFIRNTRIKKQITIHTSRFAPSIPIFADRDQLKQVLMNVILNAIDAIEYEGTIDVSVQHTKIESEAFYSITVADNGRGIEKESLEKLFDPFFTTKEDGTGLGLSISFGIIHRHRGRIDIGNRTGGGAQVVIHLPQGNENDE